MPLTYLSLGDIFPWLWKAVIWLTENLLLLVIGAFLAMVLSLFIRLRRSVLFNAWRNQTDDPRLDLGKSLADLLLHEVRDIHHIHNRAPQAGLWNEFRDVPAFSYEIDQNLTLLASSEISRDNALVNAAVSLVVQVVPIVFQPAKVSGSIQKIDDRLVFLVALDGYRPPGGDRRKKVTRVWEETVPSDSPGERRDAVKRLAYSLYLELAGGRLFKGRDAFRVYTLGLQSHLQFLDFGRRDDQREAERLYRRAMEIDAESAPPHYNLAALYYFDYKQRHNQSAIDELYRAISSHDRRLQAEVYSALANCLIQRKTRFAGDEPHDLEEAVYYARQALRNGRHLDAVHKALGFAYHQLSATEVMCAQKSNIAKEYRRAYWHRVLAIHHYKKAICLNPRHFIAHNNLGNLYLEWGQRTEGLSSPRRLLGGRFARSMRGRSLQKAIKHFTSCTSIRPSYAHAYDNLGNAYIALGEYSKARRALEYAIHFDVDYYEAKNDLGILFLRTRDTNRMNSAQCYHRQALDGAPSEAVRQKLCSKTVDANEGGCPFRAVDFPLQLSGGRDWACPYRQLENASNSEGGNAVP